MDFAMSLIKKPLPPDDGWRWQFIWRRRFGDYVVTLEWMQRRYTDKGALNYSVEWRDKTGQTIHTEFGQHQPEW